ncbi:DUF3604 domain-containing protein [Saliphagus infecundisoli]|uniref:DUF3604 domain-containing protein n=1 Tax=Saliphagus infecundisoli TaxID=1849069 RepID=A0ABD5QAR6_9EURY|nr:DUF3604 domain-containing protein [Saliphagus infecundisoli]
MSFESVANYQLFWGDLHKHMTGPGADRSELDTVLEYAQQHLDVSVVQCYPFKWYRKGREGGIREESVGPDAEFESWWDDIQAVSVRNNNPQEFVTFPAYEWNGNRTRWGDHNVYYKDEGNPLDQAWDLTSLLENASDREALVFPHHTAYDVGNRGKDWDIYEDQLSPVAEIYSSHGSSESIDSPVSMEQNPDTGPRTAGGTYVDGLNQGHHVGVIASNDGPGLPGTWGKGVAGIWATELTRDAVWEALKERRTYGVTGDRITLWWSIDGHPLGSHVTDTVKRQAVVDVDCPLPLDRVELIYNGDVERVYTHQDTSKDEESDCYRLLMEFGWGPTPEYGDFDETEFDWSGTIRARNGTVTEIQPRFRGFGQTYDFTDGECEFDLVTSRDNQSYLLPEGDADRTTQGFIVEVTGSDDTTIVVDVEDERLEIPLESARATNHLFAFENECRNRLIEEFELHDEDINNPDIVYHNSRKVRVSRAYHESSCQASVEFDELPASDDEDYYYVRVAQRNGQYAWGSPIWIDN